MVDIALPDRPADYSLVMPPVGDYGSDLEVSMGGGVVLANVGTVSQWRVVDLGDGPAIQAYLGDTIGPGVPRLESSTPIPPGRVGSVLVRAIFNGGSGGAEPRGRVEYEDAEEVLAGIEARYPTSFGGNPGTVSYYGATGRNTNIAYSTDRRERRILVWRRHPELEAMFGIGGVTYALSPTVTTAPIPATGHHQHAFPGGGGITTVPRATPRRIAMPPSAHLRLHSWEIWNLDPETRGMYRARQRQSPAGADGWPLRQRQNAGATGTWPLRQRQNGM